MKSFLTICVIAGLMLVVSTPASGAITMTFEGMSDGQLVGTYYFGVTYAAAGSGQDWVAADVTTGGYNASSWPSGTSWGSGEYWMYDDVTAWTGVVGGDGKISFDNADATYVELGYAAYILGGGTALWMDAYDSGDVLIASDSGVSNLRYTDNNSSGPGTLRVDAPTGKYISYVLIHDTGNFWEVDNIETDATGIGVIPAPGAILLGSIGVGLVGWLRRRRSL